MVDTVCKDGATIITIIPENKEEERLLRQINDYKTKQTSGGMSPAEYWAIKPNVVQTSISDFVPAPQDWDNPFETKKGAKSS